jgi:peptidoglycan hydrolase-like protein with peptidoglycan-binding domain
MSLRGQIRLWGRLGLASLFCLAAHSTVSQTSPPSAKAAHTSTSTVKKSTKHTTGHATSKGTVSHTTKKTRSKKVAKKRGQQAIDSARAGEIQAALIRQNYMQGEPSGSWDSATQAAMRRYQTDHGWQSKTIPDSRALIRLGLGPSSDHLLNPESAMTAEPGATDPKAAVKKNSADDNLPKQ